MTQLLSLFYQWNFTQLLCNGYFFCTVFILLLKKGSTNKGCKVYFEHQLSLVVLKIPDFFHFLRRLNLDLFEAELIAKLFQYHLLFRCTDTDRKMNNWGLRPLSKFCQLFYKYLNSTYFVGFAECLNIRVYGCHHQSV